MLSENQIINVLSLGKFDEHDAISDAVQSARKQLKTERSRLVGEEFGGKTIQHVEWSDSSAIFRFGNSKCISVVANACGVQWHWGDSEDLNSPKEGYPRTLLLQRLNNKQILTWERASILERRVGFSFVRIVQSGSNAFVYVEQCPVLLFCVLRIDGEEQLLLSWNDSE